MKSIEDVAYMLHTGHESESGKEVTFDVANEHVKKSEACLFCEAYEKLQCPTIAMLEMSCKKAVAVVQEEVSFVNDPQMKQFLSETVTFLENRVEQVHYFVTGYVETIASFQAVKQLASGMEDWRLQDRLENIDRARRRAHDALITSLSELTARIQKLVEEGYVDEQDVVYWNGWAHPLTNQKDSAIVVFSPSIVTHERRKEIQEWAIAADFSISLEQYEKTA